MTITKKGIAVLLFVSAIIAPLFASGGNEKSSLKNKEDSPTAIDVQENFDYMGPVVKKLTLSNGKTVAYVDEGEPDWTPVLFVGGAGTAERVMILTDFLRSFRKQLKLRIITVGRNGLGETGYVPDWTYQDYAREVGEVLDFLEIDEFVGMAISGGGPYLASVSAAMPERILSLHMAAALSRSAPDAWNATGTVEELEQFMRTYPANPLSWWDLGENAPTAIVPGFQDTANEDGTRSFFMGGQLGIEDQGIRTVQRAMAEEYKRFSTPLPDLSEVKAPTYTYYSPDDTSVGMEHEEYWKNHLNVVKSRVYPKDGHAVQYRHWGQIMLDMAGYSDYLLISDSEQSLILPEDEGMKLIEEGSAEWGIHAWRSGGE